MELPEPDTPAGLTLLALIVLVPLVVLVLMR